MKSQKKAKTPSDVEGYKSNCLNFQRCPLCFGCRRYSSIDPACVLCKENSKINICNKDLHKDGVTAHMITKNKIKLSNISFENNIPKKEQ